MKEKITMLVNSCDKNSHLWKPFSALFNLYWDKNIDIKKYILSETIVDNIEGFDFILAGKNSWTKCVLHALNQIKTKYVFWWIEDFFMIDTIKYDSFETFIYLMEHYGADKFVIHHPHAELKLSPLLPEHNIFTMNSDSPYTTTLQPSIWDVEHFKSCLLDDETPWQFELQGSERLNARTHTILLYQTPSRWHYEALYKGNPTPEYYHIINHHNLQHLIVK